MRNPVDVYLIAQNCLTSHTATDDELVNIGGHSASTLDFAFVAWSQDAIRHSFALSGPTTNQVPPVEKRNPHIRRGPDCRTGGRPKWHSDRHRKTTDGATVAKQAARAAARLKSGSQKVHSPTIESIL